MNITRWKSFFLSALSRVWLMITLESENREKTGREWFMRHTWGPVLLHGMLAPGM